MLRLMPGSASWMDADDLFTDNAKSAILNANGGNLTADWNKRIAAPSLTGKINAAVWKNGKTVKLPAAMKENSTLVYLHYRYVETGVELYSSRSDTGHSYADSDQTGKRQLSDYRNRSFTVCHRYGDIRNEYDHKPDKPEGLLSFQGME